MGLSGEIRSGQADQAGSRKLRVEKLEQEVKDLWNIASKIPELKRKLEKIYAEILARKQPQENIQYSC